GRADRQLELDARVSDRAALVVGRRERILEDVVGVEPDLLRLRNPLEHAERRPVPRRTDQTELELWRHQEATCAARAPTSSAVPDGRKSSVSKRLRSPRCRPTKYSTGLPPSRYVTPVNARIGASSLMPRCRATSAFAARASIERTPR